jgi:hypothetical protein
MTNTGQGAFPSQNTLDDGWARTSAARHAQPIETSASHVGFRRIFRSRA